MSNFRTVDIRDIDQFCREKEARLFDVRTDNEVRQTGMIRVAKHLPIKKLPQIAGQIDPQRPTIFYCQTGSRSSHAAASLTNLGCQIVNSMTDGLATWLRAGKPVKK